MKRILQKFSGVAASSGELVVYHIPVPPQRYDSKTFTLGLDIFEMRCIVSAEEAAKLGNRYRVRTHDFLKWWDSQVKQEQKNILKNLVS